MLSEEAFVLVVFLVACASVALGTLELIWPTRPRHPVRRSAVGRDPWRRARSRSAPGPERIPVGIDATEARAIPAAADLPLVVREAPALTASAAAFMDAPSPSLPQPDAHPEPLEERAPAEAEQPVEMVENAAGDESVAERCFALLADDRFAEVVTLGEEGLAALKATVSLAPSAAAAEEMGRLWGAVGLARKGLDDFERARFAFEEAIAVAPQAQRPIWERHLAALALTTGRRMLEAGGAGPERLESIRSAIEWLGRGLAVAPDDAALHDALVAARDALWRTNEELIRGFVRRKDLAGARRHLDDVIADPECPPERQRAFRALWSGAMGRQAGRATTEALRHVQGGREDKAVAALARADAVMTQIPPDALAPRRRQELMRRLWLGHMKLGVARLEAGAQEAALSLLFQALAITDVGEDRLEETRATLVRALEEIAAERSVDIAALVDAGDPGAAAIQGDKLWSLLRGAVDQGLPQDDLADAFARVSAVFIKNMGGPEMAPQAPPFA